MSDADEDARDVLIARERLAEIERNPGGLVRGRALDRRMEKWLAEAVPSEKPS